MEKETSQTCADFREWVILGNERTWDGCLLFLQKRKLKSAAATSAPDP
jgi:hypothetical protein